MWVFDNLAKSCMYMYMHGSLLFVIAIVIISLFTYFEEFFCEINPTWKFTDIFLTLFLSFSGTALFTNSETEWNSRKFDSYVTLNQWSILK